MTRASHPFLARSGLVLLGIVLAAFAAELSLRLAHRIGEARRGDLRAELERSATAPLEPSSFRLGGLVRPSEFPRLVYELKPNLTGTFIRQPLRINSRGMRGPEVAAEKPPGVYRIAGIGDSVMFGWGVREEDSYLRVLERRLNEIPGDRPRFEVLNFAVPGYNTALEVEALRRKALALSPDLVIVHFVNNDFQLPSFLQRPDAGEGFTRSYLVDFLADRLGRRGRSTELLGADLRDLERDEKREVLAPYRNLVGVRSFRTALSRLAKLARKHGFRVLVLLGSSTRAQREIVEAEARRHAFPLLSIRPYTHTWAEAHGLTTREERSRVLSLMTTLGDPHPSAAGHAVYAAALFEELQRIGVAPAAR